MVTPAHTLHRLDGKYRVLAQLGQGGTADVFLALGRGPNDFSKLAVLKAMRTSLRYEREFTEMFLNEARLAARLNHPNVVQTNEVFEFDGLPVIVMEYLEGQPLSQLISRAGPERRLPVRLCIHILSEALAGLHYSHDLTDFDGSPLLVVHRDMSPHNIFVTFTGQIKVLDFGIAKLANSQVETATGIIKGKLRYMPPEQLGGEPVDRRADLFSVGVMLWEAATGQKMWAGMSDANIIKAIGEGAIPSAREYCRDLDDDLEGILARALAPDPADRFATAKALKGALDTYLNTSGPPLEDKDVEDMMAELFGDLRAETRAMIEQQMIRVQSLSPSELEEFLPLELMHGSTPAGLTSSRMNRFSSPKPGSRLLPSLLTVVAAFVLALLFFAWLRPDPASAPAALTLETAAPLEATEPARVQLRVTAFPQSATLYLDGEELDSNPYSRSFPRDQASLHQLRAAAAGHAEKTHSFAFDRDQEIVIALVPEPEGTEPIQAVRSLPRSTPSSPSSPLPSPCEPPFSIDARGVKKFKPECLE